MHPRRADRQRVGLKTRQHQGPRCQAQALVTHPAQLTMAVMAIDRLNGRIVQRKLNEGFGQGR